MKNMIEHIKAHTQKSPSHKKRLFWMLLGLSLVFGGIIGFNLFKSFMIKRFFANYQAPAVSVSSAIAQSDEWHPTLETIGTFVAINGVELTPEVAGKVSKIHFESGQYIEQGSPLLDLDDSIEQSELKFNQADLALKDINYTRQVSLFKKGATPGSSVDEAKASLDQAKANVDKTETRIKQKHIVAPFSGMLGIRLVNLGQYLSPGQNSIVNMQSQDPLYLEFYLPEQNLKNLHLKQNIDFSIEGARGFVFSGIINAIDAKADINTHNIRIQATVPNCPEDAIKHPLNNPLVKIEKDKNNNLVKMICNSQTNKEAKIKKFAFIPGMFASIEVAQAPKPNTITLPSTAISYSLYGNSVFVIEEDKNAGKDKSGQPIYTVNRVFVTTGQQRGNHTVIESGIKPGQMVVSSGELKLQNGTRVIINNDVPLHDKSIAIPLNE